MAEKRLGTADPKSWKHLCVLYCTGHTWHTFWATTALLHFSTYIPHDSSRFHVCSTQQLPAVPLWESTKSSRPVFLFLALHCISIFHSAAGMSTIVSYRRFLPLLKSNIKQFKSFSSGHNSNTVLQLLLAKAYSTSQKVNSTPPKN